jgi:hypothetical protein
MTENKSKTMTATFADFMPEKSEMLFSVGGCCQILNITPLQLSVLMHEAGVKFVRCVDAVPYVDGVQCETLSAKLNEIKTRIQSKVEAVKASAANN